MVAQSLTLQRWIFLGVVSIVVHIFVLASLKEFSESQIARFKMRVPVAIRVSQSQKVEQPTPVPIAKSTPLPKKHIVQSATAKPVEKPTPVPEMHGLSASSFAPAQSASSTSTEAVAGNSLIVPDTGVRKAPEEVVALPKSTESVDLSETAHIDLKTLVRPEYTKDALKVRLLGSFPVDVHVSAGGEVLEVEFSKAIGFGMDERIRAALLKAHFFPERDKSGKAMETWVTIQFKLEMPN